MKPVDFDVVIVGAGAAGIATAASLRKRHKDIAVAVVDPADVHYYQPGWTLVGAGVFSPEHTLRQMDDLIPKGVQRIKARVSAFKPEESSIALDDRRRLRYRRLVVCPGLELNWNGIEGLNETLGKNGVTSNYRYDLAPYTWELAQKLKEGQAVFTQPPMPIKCAGAPQKAMYLSCDHWLKSGNLDNIEVDFFNAGPGLFGVADYVPALMKYIDKYGVNLKFGHKLTRIDGASKTAWFTTTGEAGESREVAKEFDMIHVCPPQRAPQFIRESELVDDAGWVNVDQNTLRHKTYDNIWSLGDVTNSPNAKTAAAARKQAPIVAHNVVCDIRGETGRVAHYDGYGSCPLTVERGKIVLAEFGFGGKLLPSFPNWIIDGRKASRLAWFLKEILLPPIYWKAMLRGREWLAKPTPAES